jgi:hydrogenase nickel incorporation protein HypA/HybF
MHEMSLAESVVQIAEETARGHGGSRISLVLVEVGQLAGVEIEALRFCFEVARRESLAADATLVIEQPDGQAWCMPCGETVSLSSLADPCPRCGSHQLQVTGGNELKVREVEIH